jgi:hypothetical protein
MFDIAPAPSSESRRGAAGRILDALLATAGLLPWRIGRSSRHRPHPALDPDDVARSLDAFDLPYDAPYLLRAARAGVATHGEWVLVMDLIARYSRDGMGALISPNELAVLQRCAGPGWIGTTHSFRGSDCVSTDRPQPP